MTLQPIDSSKAATRYGFALVVSLLAFLLTRLLTPTMENNFFDLFQGAVVISACYGGLGPGLLSAVIAVVALDYFFLPPLHTFTVEASGFLRLAVFTAVAIVTSSISARLKETKSELQKAHDQLESRVAERTEELSRANENLEEEIAHRLEAERQILQISSREQRRLGEDLHDGVCQTLAGLRLLSQELKGKLSAEGLPWVGDVERIQTRLGEALTQADIVAHGLYPVELETDGLMAALEELAAKISTLYRVHCQFKCPVPVLIQDASTANHLFRIAQEAVINAIKRGKAKHIIVRLVTQDSRSSLSITDNGIGFEGPRPRRGMGLKMMMYRARMINATLRIRSRSRGVTRVTCVFPSAIKEEVLSHEKI